MNLKNQIALVIAAGLTVAASTQAATILYSDNFNRTAGVNASGTAGGLSDWGANNNALGGSLTQTYKVRDTAAGASTEQQFVDGNLGRLRLGHGVVNTDLLLNPLVNSGGYRVAFDFQRGNGGYIAFALGITPTEIQAHAQNNARIGVPFATNIPETDFGFLFRPSAASEVWKSGVTAVGPAGIFNAAVITGSPTTLLNNAVVDITPAVAGQWGVGAVINVSLTVNGGSPDYVTTFVSNNLVGPGYFGFHSNAGAAVTQAGIDNLVITALGNPVVPEPTTLAAFSAIAGSALIRRRR